MAVKIQNTHILYMDELDAIEDDEVFANFGQESILHPEPKPRTTGFKTKEEFKEWLGFHLVHGKKIKKPRWSWGCLATPILGVVGVALLIVLVCNVPKDLDSFGANFFLALVGFLMVMAFVVALLARKFGLCCKSDEIKVSRVYNHNPDEYIDIDY